LDDVLRLWAGLGYYRRARHLYACAQILCKDHKGVFPKTEEELMALPGFGPYTAAAVAAIAFHQRATVVDGNVERVVARLFAVRTPLAKAKKILRVKAAKLLPNQRYGDYAQALMDLGATICTPRNPKCDLCPWIKSCRAHERGMTAALPRQVKPQKKPIRHTIAFLVLNKKGEILIRQRPSDGLLGGMMEIPSSAWREGKPRGLKAAQHEAPVELDWRLLPRTITHVFSHFELRIRVAIGTISRPRRGLWVAPSKLQSEALPSVMHKIARYALGLI
jgi:A/G-specific adenine glycosylase